MTNQVSSNSRFDFSCGAKTFLFGEYAALIQGPAVLVSTTPRLNLQVSILTEDMREETKPSGRFAESVTYILHSDSLAAKLVVGSARVKIEIEKQKIPLNGLGVSTAEYLALWGYFQHRFHEATDSLIFNSNHLEDYRALSTSEIKPSGYDLITQSYGGVVQIQKTKNGLAVASTEWPFENLGFLLCYTHKKLQTHIHLKTLANNEEDLIHLSKCSSEALAAFQSKSEAGFVKGIKKFQEELERQKKVSEHTLEILQHFLGDQRTSPHIEAAKGCGAMGADVICFFSYDVETLRHHLLENQYGLEPFATHLDITGAMNLGKIES